MGVGAGLSTCTMSS